jgi:hypothetical protein
MNLFLVVLVLAALHLALGGWALAAPGSCSASLRGFARNVPLGMILMILGTGWFFWNLYTSDLTDFKALRPFLYAGVVLVGVGNCLFVQDFIAVRGAAVVALLLCDKVLDWQRWFVTPGFNPQSWLQPKNLIALWCYAVILFSVWLVHSPWRLRDVLDWSARTPERLRQTGMTLAGFGVVLAGVGLVWLR